MHVFFGSGSGSVDLGDHFGAGGLQQAARCRGSGGCFDCRECANGQRRCEHAGSFRISRAERGARRR